MKRHICNFLDDDSGATAVEYALLSGIIALLLITSLTNLGTRLSGNFSEVSNTFK